MVAALELTLVWKSQEWSNTNKETVHRSYTMWADLIFCFHTALIIHHLDGATHVLCLTNPSVSRVKGRIITVRISGRMPLRCREEESGAGPMGQQARLHENAPIPMQVHLWDPSSLPAQKTCRWMFVLHRAVGKTGSQQAALLRGWLQVRTGHMISIIFKSILNTS